MRRLITLLLLGALCALCAPRVQARPNAADSIPDAYTGTLDSLALYIDSHCRQDTAKLRMLYAWMVGHMRYNVYPTFVSANQKRDEAREVSQALRQREGVCRHFAKIFQAVSERMDIPAFFIEGYTQRGGVVVPEPHAWCVALVGGQWYGYDPTHGMGYVQNYRFISASNFDFCQVRPEDLIVTHMPFDPMWQLLEHPCPYPDFDHGQGRPQAVGGPSFAFADSIRIHLNQRPLQQLAATNARIRRNGAPNPLVDYYLQLNTANMSVHRQNEVYEIYKNALKHYNSCVDTFNAVVRYQRTHPKLKKDDRRLMTQWLTDAAHAVALADSIMQPAVDVPQQYATAVGNLKEAIAELAAKVERKQLAVEKR